MFTPTPTDSWSHLGPIAEQIRHDLELKYAAISLAQARRATKAQRRLYLRARGAYGQPH